MTENGKVTIVADDNGGVIRVSKNNPEFGHVRLVQDKTFIGTGGWVKKNNRSTLIHGTVEDLQAVGLADKKELPGQIVIKEQFEPFSSDNPERDLKIAGDTGIICVGTNTETGEVDAPIYRKAFYSMDVHEQDVLIAHTNGNAIREANGAPAKTVVSKEQLEQLTNPDEDQPKATRRKKKEEEKQVDLVDSIDEIETEDEVEVVEDNSFEL